MKLSVFVSSSAAVLAVWLTVTYLARVPAEAYPKLGRGSLPQTAKHVPVTAKPLVGAEREEEEIAGQ